MVGVGVSWPAVAAAAEPAEGLAIRIVAVRGGAAARGVRLLRMRRGTPIFPRPRHESRGLLEMGARHGFSISIRVGGSFPTFARQRVSALRVPRWSVL